nr:PE family protein [Mycobacterium gastri]
MASAATDLASIGSTISSANAAAAVPTTGLLAAGADEVSAILRRCSPSMPRSIRR